MINRGNDVELRKAACFIKVLVIFHKEIFNHSTTTGAVNSVSSCKGWIIPHAETEIGTLIKGKDIKRAVGNRYRIGIGKVAWVVTSLFPYNSLLKKHLLSAVSLDVIEYLGVRQLLLLGNYVLYLFSWIIYFGLSSFVSWF